MSLVPPSADPRQEEGAPGAELERRASAVPAMRTARVAVAAKAGPVRGRLVLAATGLSLAGLGVDVSSPVEFTELAFTDAEGRFQTEDDYLYGPVDLEIEVGDRGSDVIHLRIEHAPDAEPVLALDGLEPYRLDFDLPEGYEPDEVEASFGETPTGADDGTGWPSRLDPHVFFLPPRPRTSLPWLRLATIDGVWRAAVPRPLPGMTTRIELARPATLHVRLDGTAAREDTADAVIVDAASGATVASEELRFGDWNELTVLTGLLTLRITSEAHEPVTRTVEVFAGEPTELEIALVRRSSAGDVAGVVTTASGDRRYAWVELDVAGVRFDAVVEWEDEGERVLGRFHIPDVPPGAGRLRVVSGGLPDVEPASVLVRAPATDLAFRIDDEVPWVYAYGEAVDARTGKPIERWQGVLLDDRGRWITSIGHDEGAALVRGDLALRWLAAAEGYAPAQGGAEAARRETDVDFDEPFVVVTAALEPVDEGEEGASLLWVVDRDDAGQAGVTVVLDDALAGTTDARGLLALPRGTRPSTWRLELPGWELESCDWQWLPGVARAWMIRQ